ncbi:biosynthetic arginine decarboxylase [Kaarinaea lacus]
MWNIEKAREAYNFTHWSNGYFDVGDSGRHHGHLIVRPDANEKHQGIDLHELTNKLQQQGLTLPVLVRFTDILHDRVKKLCTAFTQSMQTHHYHGNYTVAYPIKVNQQQSVVNEILSCHSEKDNLRVGLEAGSKPELMVVLAISKPGINTIICNGYKDREYIRLALIGQQMGHRIYIVLEKPAELELVIEEARKMNISPNLGARIRLTSIGRGNWQNSGGEKSKFGLSAAHLLHVVEQLREANMLESLKLLHCHMGSQLANIRDIQLGMRECARFYCELHKLGVNITSVDVGGGLGIDYEGTHSRRYCSMNYSLQEYAHNVVHTLWETCIEHDLPHPDIISESGRALTAHHAVLVTEVINTEQVIPPEETAPPDDDEPMILHDMWRAMENLGRDNPRIAIESYHDAVHWFGEAQTMYMHGVITLSQRAKIEELYYAICSGIRHLLNPGNKIHREILDEINDKLADKYFCNFSLFQSLPDVWAIDQVFPIVPLHRLDQEPDRRGTIQDITCDSDGCIKNYVDSDGVETSLPLHSKNDGETYRLGIFLAGAYQEILGDMHNLFGDTCSVNLRLDGKKGYKIEQVHTGDTVEHVLRYVNFEAKQLLAAYRDQIDQADLKNTQRKSYLKELRAGLKGYTYLED